ncbi:TetR family transcriptional regulator [Photobacterium proteolyticum]|uniref:TetR family transcriptional regulator n=1 Tax=Photobacterium proteolyticum TaxID=1903952 RepID=A0A1Q9GT13_9GAMM|nr:TetR/AcrR family transcriptional regulator [Photobacterium proteolyticum]OLQ78180.1 TetR family transcriptional regulator [Photobacterium proteolyticum]
MAKTKQQNILDTALSLFVRNGIQATSTASIAKQANVATGTLFHHFASKQALIITLYSNIKTELGQAMQPQHHHDDIQAQVRHFWQQALQWAQDNPDKLHFMQQIAHDPAFEISLHQELMAVSMGFMIDQVQQAQAQQQLAPLPLELVLNFCHSHFLATANLFAERPDFACQPDYQEGAFQILWRGLAPTAP